MRDRQDIYVYMIICFNVSQRGSWLLSTGRRGSPHPPPPPVGRRPPSRLAGDRSVYGFPSLPPLPVSALPPPPTSVLFSILSKDHGEYKAGFS